MPIALSSPENVLRIPELLELILLSLPESTLLTTAQLVCKSWHDFITSSQRIQQTLFFAPCPNVAPFRLNPLLVRHFPIFFDGAYHTSKGLDKLSFGARGRDGSPERGDESTDDDLTDDGLSDGEDDESESPEIPSLDARGRNRIADKERLTPVPDNRALRGKFLHPSASWRRMLLSQPYTELPLWHCSTGWMGRRHDWIKFAFKHPSHTHFNTRSDHDSNAPTVDQGSHVHTMGFIYDRAIAYEGCFGIWWDLQKRMARERMRCKPEVEPGPADDSEPDLSVGPDLRYDMPIDNRRAQVNSGDGKLKLEMRLLDALNDHNAVFRAFCFRYDTYRWRGRGVERRSKRKTLAFTRYYSFPAADLPMESESHSDDESSDRDE